jgi:hypothetical protein
VRPSAEASRREIREGNLEEVVYSCRERSHIENREGRFGKDWRGTEEDGWEAKRGGSGFGSLKSKVGTSGGEKSRSGIRLDYRAVHPTSERALDSTSGPQTRKYVQLIGLDRASCIQG